MRKKDIEKENRDLGLVLSSRIKHKMIEPVYDSNSDFFALVRFFDTSSAELISTFVPVHTSECRKEVLLSTMSR